MRSTAVECGTGGATRGPRGRGGWDGRLPAAPNGTRARRVRSPLPVARRWCQLHRVNRTDRPRTRPRHEVGVAGCAVNGLRRQPGAPRQRGRGCYGRAVVRRVCGHVARRLAYQRVEVCPERRALEIAALPTPERHVPRSPFRREATITARDIRARRAASPAAPVTPLPRRARRSRLTRAGCVPVALPLFPPGVFYQRQPARNRVTNHRRDGQAHRVRFRFECRSHSRLHRHAQLS